MKKLIVFLFAIVNLTSFSAPKEVLDTVYYDNNWKGCSRTFAHYYRVMTIPSDDNPRKQMRDFFITGEIAGEAKYISIDRDDDSRSIFDGEYITYYKSGAIKHQSNWMNSHRIGDSYDFYENGNVKQHCQYNDEGNIEGAYSEFDINGNLIKLFKYNNGIPEPTFTAYNQFGAMGRYNTRTLEFESEDVSQADMKTKYIKGEKYYYFDNKNGLYISTVVDAIKQYGKYYRVCIFLFNNSNESFTFDPTLVTASGKFYKKTKKNGKTPYHSIKARRNEKGEFTYDPSTEKIKDIRVWTYKDYMNKVEERQDWDKALMEFAQGISTSNAGYSVSYTQTNNTFAPNISFSSATYNAAEAAIVKEMSANKISTYAASLESESQNIKDNYMQVTTLDPQEEAAGYILLNKDEPVIIDLSIPVNGVVYTFEITDIPN